MLYAPPEVLSTVLAQEVGVLLDMHAFLVHASYVDVCASAAPYMCGHDAENDFYAASFECWCACAEKSVCLLLVTAFFAQLQSAQIRRKQSEYNKYVERYHHVALSARDQVALTIIHRARSGD